MKITSLAAFVTAVAAIAAAAGPAHAETAVLRFSHFVPTTHRIHAGVEMWAKAVEEASGGEIDVQIFPAQQLGKARDHYDMVEQGIADVAWVVPGYQPGRFPVISVSEIPFMYPNADEGSKAFDEWYRPYAAEEMAGVKYCLMFLQEPGVLHSKKALPAPSDLKGMKIRPATATLGRFLGELGASAVSIPAPEAREAAERGVIDALTFGWQTAINLGATKELTYHMDLPYYSVATGYVMNKASYERLSDKAKRVIDQHCSSDWAQKIGNDWGSWERGGRETLLKDSGQTVYEVSAENVAAWRAAAEPLRAQWRADVAEVGVDGDAALAELEATLKKYGAAY